jgi:putative ABC transport system substrate-binding protein
VFDLVTELHLPTMYLSPEEAEQGGLIAYGSRFYECYSRVVELAIKVIKGAKPADLPIEQPTKLELAINMKAAKALGLAVPPLLLAQASEVIE